MEVPAAVNETNNQNTSATTCHGTFHVGLKSSAGIEIIVRQIHHRIEVNKLEISNLYTPARFTLRRKGRSPIVARIEAAVRENPASRPAVAAVVMKTSLISGGIGRPNAIAVLHTAAAKPTAYGHTI